MKKRKIRINGMDFAILAVIAAAVLLILYVFVWSGKADTAAQNEKAEILYVVEIIGVDEPFVNLIREGQRVEDAVARGFLGTVEGKPEVRDMLKADYDNATGEEVYYPVPGRFNLYITIRAEADVTNRGYSVNDEYVYVGAQMSLLFPEMKCDGFCIQLDVVE